MKSLAGSILFFTILSFTACVSEPSNNQNGTDTPIDTTIATPPVDVKKPDCPIAGKVLDGNQFWANKENLVISISADKETEDPDLGESHRILQVFDGTNCQQVFKEILPVNLSADYPYYLSQITYNNVSKAIAIRGFDRMYVFDLANRKLVGPLVPKFLNQRYVDDAQSGMISRLEVWETYMIGYAASMGPFVFDLSNLQQPQPVLAFAEFELEKGTRYNSLFMLKSYDANDGAQLLLPTYDAETEEFKINPLFQQPRKMETTINKKFKNNRYIVLKEYTSPTENIPVAIDMSKMKLVDLPDGVAKKKDTEIIEWMKKN